MRLNIPVLLEDAPANRQGAVAAAPAQSHGHDHADDPSQPIAGPAPVFIHVGDTPISEADIAREMQHHRSARPEQARADAARALVVRELLRREIDRLQLAGQVQPEGAETREEAAIRVLIDCEVETPEPAEADCLRYYEANRERMHAPDRARVRHILLAAAPADSYARNKARELGEKLISILKLEPARFGELATAHSACPSREDGGDLGWISPGDTVPEFERQVFRLKPGMAGLTVETRYGHHVVMLDEQRRGESLSFADCRDRIATYLETQVRQNAIHQYLTILAERYEASGLETLETP